MSQSTHSREKSPQSRPQHKPGLACEECRRRKLRCDRRQPKCGLCESSGVECQITARPPRGPKRGYLKVLQDRIANLEGLLQQNNTTANPPSDGGSFENLLLEEPIDLPLWEFPINMDEDNPLLEACARAKSSHSSGESSVEGMAGTPVSSMLALDPTLSLNPWNPFEFDTKISDLMQADLDQLYFDRIHNFMPILHPGRYFASRKQQIRTDGQWCLQYAMWTLAASVSAHYQNVGDSLYQHTRRSLETLDSKNTKLESMDLEQVQAWLLLAIHEFMCIDFRRGWMSAGRAFRLIQLSWRHGTDGPDQAQGDWIESEQKRRTFWMAYCLDRFVSMRIGSPLTFSETIAIRLPCPENNFQNDQPIVMGFLSETLVAASPTVVSAFTECIIVATISGHTLSHRHQYPIRDIGFNALEAFWAQHQWIKVIHNQWMESFSSKYPADMQQSDPMLLFIGLMYRIITLHLYQTTACMIPAADEEQRDVVIENRTRASLAAKEIVGLINQLSHLNSFKLHPLTPIPLSLCVEFFVSNNEPGDGFAKELQDIIQAISCLKNFNNIGKGISHLFEERGAAAGIPAIVQ
ncbi:uncharacterized protein N7503_007101 [Penicillium pulvis]|uniref:uncharacterized protein n=1 Tax=Penicillium pulvis TaxID=1562058 RepID=UPI0025467790|nr:uncharacterized protein N7503_007101 [Penicillium pulvis]KAJ5797805.1 hypothetical protein N7503_007101 [Penicillium pulvis]